jgi:selenocysteine lyase/cysteine desulfurase
MVLNASGDSQSSGPMITFFKPETDMAALHQRLEENGIIASLRMNRANQSYLRLAPHFYNTDQELRRVLDFL